MASTIFQLAIICGGPSIERGISLNSARSLMDHLQNLHFEIIAIYVDTSRNFYQISPAQLYSNTPADFDFKLQQTAKALNSIELKNLLKTVDLVFPAIHGAFGEDGELQTLLEHLDVPFVGHSSPSCHQMFSKHLSNEKLLEWGFPVLPYLALSENTLSINQALIEQFFHQHHLQKVVVKPSNGGSSIGVYLAHNSEEVIYYSNKIFEQKLDHTVLVEAFCEGQEFTIVVFQNFEGKSVALVPTEIELKEKGQIFDYRKKYLPTTQSSYHTPARFSETILQKIRQQAQELFSRFNMQDFARLDGWVMSDGTLYFTDNNPLSGMEQNSFLFLQTALIEMSHSQTLHYLVKRACQRYHIAPPCSFSHANHKKQGVHVLFGGANAERQVSLMSGTNVWLKLLQSENYYPVPYFLDKEEKVWQLPYLYPLHHTVEEVYAQCLKQKDPFQDSLVHQIQQELMIEGEMQSLLSCQTLEEFIDQAQAQQAFVFLALHGGKGEDGTIQKLLEDKQVVFNGSSSTVSETCMDKYATGQIIDALQHPQLSSLPKCVFSFRSYTHYTLADWENLWNAWCERLKSNQLIIKPRSEGCSSGIVVLQSFQDIACYAQLQKEQAVFIPSFTFAHQKDPIEMSPEFNGDYLLEPYIEVDDLTIQNQQLHYSSHQGWLELTVGVIEQEGHYHALSPSLTVTEGAVLSLEEKFQGGTGINLTPPPENILSSQQIDHIEQLIEIASHALNIKNYARLDVFYNRLSQKMILIEANTLPALTPSTVIYHQALAENPPLKPLEFLEQIIASKLNSSKLISKDLESVEWSHLVPLTS